MLQLLIQKPGYNLPSDVLLNHWEFKIQINHPFRHFPFLSITSCSSILCAWQVTSWKAHWVWCELCADLQGRDLNPIVVYERRQDAKHWPELELLETREIWVHSKPEKWPSVLGRGYYVKSSPESHENRATLHWHYETEKANQQDWDRAAKVSTEDGGRWGRKESFAPHTSHFSTKVLPSRLPWVTLPSFFLWKRKATNKQAVKVSKVLVIPLPSSGTILL